MCDLVRRSKPGSFVQLFNNFFIGMWLGRTERNIELFSGGVNWKDFIVVGVSF